MVGVVVVEADLHLRLLEGCHVLEFLEVLHVGHGVNLGTLLVTLRLVIVAVRLDVYLVRLLLSGLCIWGLTDFLLYIKNRRLLFIIIVVCELWVERVHLLNFQLLFDISRVNFIDITDQLLVQQGCIQLRQMIFNELGRLNVLRRTQPLLLFLTKLYWQLQLRLLLPLATVCILWLIHFNLTMVVGVDLLDENIMTAQFRLCSLAAVIGLVQLVLVLQFVERAAQVFILESVLVLEFVRLHHRNVLRVIFVLLILLSS